jgi:hypothetical protein
MPRPECGPHGAVRATRGPSRRRHAEKGERRDQLVPGLQKIGRDRWRHGLQHGAANMQRKRLLLLLLLAPASPLPGLGGESPYLQHLHQESCPDEKSSGRYPAGRMSGGGGYCEPKERMKLGLKSGRFLGLNFRSWPEGGENNLLCLPEDDDDPHSCKCCH